jgi:hypothetical protein
MHGRPEPLRHSAACVGKPGIKSLARDSLYSDWHEGVIAPA